jgi:Fe-S-cluster containining protein
MQGNDFHATIAAGKLNPMSPSPTERSPRWYAAGLRFACTACGNCCRHHGEYAYVYVKDHEAAAIAAHLELDLATFLERYCQREDGWLSLRMDDPACPFLTSEGRCGVYPVRPVQCRTWPFWEQTLVEEAWRTDVLKTCPGAGTGVLHSADEVEHIARAHEDWYDGDDERWCGPEPRG